MTASDASGMVALQAVAPPLVPAAAAGGLTTLQLAGAAAGAVAATAVLAAGALSVFKPAVFRHLLGSREGSAALLLPDARARQAVGVELS